MVSLEGGIGDSRKLFVSMACNKCKLNVVSYSILIDGFCLVDKIRDAK